MSGRGGLIAILIIMSNLHRGVIIVKQQLWANYSSRLMMPNSGNETYQEQHFFCAECGDPFLPPASSSHFKSPHHQHQLNRNFVGDGNFSEDGVGFTVYKGHPYCEACHVRLRLPKCKRCKKSIRDGSRAVEALGGKWCWECFVCESCQRPFEDPAFFQRGDKPYCEHCFGIIIRNEV